MQHARRTTGDRRGVPVTVDAVTRGLEADESALDASGMNAAKMPIAFEPPPTHAATTSGSPASALENLGARLRADDSAETRAPSSGSDAGPPRCRAGSASSRRSPPSRGSASLIASFRVRDPVPTGTTSAAE